MEQTSEQINNDTPNLNEENTLPQIPPQSNTPPNETLLAYDLSKITNDPVSARIISPAYATKCGELNAVLTYSFQYTVFDFLGNTTVARQLEDIAISEMRHLNLLAKTLIRLGVTPIYTSFPQVHDMFYSSRSVNYSTAPKQMIINDIAGETRAIVMYQSMLTKLLNPNVKLIIASILQDEQKHLVVLNNILQTL